MINDVLNVILPGDKNLGLPSAKLLNFELYQKNQSLHHVTEIFLEGLSSVSIDLYKVQFIDLSEQQKMKVINRYKIINYKNFSIFIQHCFRFYYTNKIVLSMLNVGATPPFPQGNVIKQNSWEILDPVIKNGYNLRKI